MKTYDGWFPRTEASFDTPLGIVAAIGFVGLLGLCLVQLVAPGRPLAPALYGNAAIASLLALLFAWAGGFAVFVALLDPQVRSWNRLSVFIAFFALLAVGLVLDRLLGRMGSIAGALLLCGVLTVGVLDQTSKAYKPRYDALATDYRSDGDFVRAVESRVPRGSMILQLPFMAFPEAPELHAMADYDLLRGYVHSRELALVVRAR